MHNRSVVLIYSLLILSAVFWGVSFIMTKGLFLTEPHLTVIILLTLRLGVASMVMVPALAFTHKLQPIRRGSGSGVRALLGGDLKWFLLLALAEPFLYSLCETGGVQYVSGSLASVIVATIPLFVPFGMWLVYRTRIRTVMFVGVLLSLVGVTVMLHGGGAFDGSAKGIILLVGAVVVAVVYTLILVKVVDRYDPIVVTTYQNLIGFLYFLPLMLAVDGHSFTLLSFSPKMILLILALGLLCSTLAYVFYNYGVRQLGPSEACIFTNAIPVFSLIAAVAIGQEEFSMVKAIGMAIALTGVVIAQIKPKQHI